MLSSIFREWAELCLRRTQRRRRDSDVPKTLSVKNRLHGAESFLRSWQFLSWCTNSPARDGNLRGIKAFTKARHVSHVSQSWARFHSSLQVTTMHGHSWLNVVHVQHQATVRCTVLCHNDFEHVLFRTVRTVLFRTVRTVLFRTVRTVPSVEDKFVSNRIACNWFARSLQCTDYTACKWLMIDCS